MIQNYKEPQLNIDQKLAVDTTAATPRQAAVLVGPQFVSPEFDGLYNYADFTVDGATLPFTFTDNGVVKTVDEDGLVYVLDSDSVELFVKNVEYDLLDVGAYIAGGNGYKVVAGENANEVISFAGDNFVAPTNILNEALAGRPVAIGDTVYVYNTETGESTSVQKRKVAGFVGKPIPATIGSDADIEDTLFGASLANPTTTIPGFDNSIFDVEASNGYTYDTSSSLSLVGPGQAIAATNLNGLSHVKDGEIFAGPRVNLRVLSFNTLSDTGTFSITSTDGNIAGVGTIEKDGTRVTFVLSATSAQHGFDTLEVSVVGSKVPTPGDTISFSYRSAYEPLDNTVHIVTGEVSNYTGTVDNTFYVKVVTGNYSTGTAVVRVYDEKGLFTPFNVNVPSGTPTVTIPVGFGITLEVNSADVLSLEQNGFRKNDTYYIKAKAATKSTVEFTGLVLDGPAANIGTPAAIKIRGLANGKVGTENQLAGTGFTVGATSAAYEAGLTWFVSGRSTGYQYVSLLDENGGKVYTNWRAAKTPSAGESRIAISGATDLAALGSMHIKNDLAYAAKKALEVANGTVFYVLRSKSGAAEDIAAALTKLENSDTSYALAILSDDKQAFTAAIEHAEAMSALDVKNFRRVYFGIDSPGSYTFLDKGSDDLNLKATVTSYGGVYRYVNFTTDIRLSESGVGTGDILRVAGTDYVVETVISDTELLLKSNSCPTLPISPAVEVSIVKSDAADNQVEYVAEVAKAASSRRGILVWCDAPIGIDQDGAYTTLPNKFVAAEIATLRSVIKPQLGLTRSGINSIVECPSMYARFNKALLNQAAANGVLIVTQEFEGGPVFVRHQLTTESDLGSLYYEDSVGTNIDNLSLKLKDVLDKYVGRRNVTPTTLGIINHEVFRIMEDARTTSISDIDVGPQILNFYDENGVAGKVTVKAHPTFKDRLLIKVRVTIPLPLNVIELEIEAVSEIVVTA